jgi:hypothetical protein
MTAAQRKRRPAGETAEAAEQENNAAEAYDPQGGKASGQRAAFTAFKFKWLSQVAQDASLPALAARIAIRIADEYFNFEKGYAWPAVSTLARWLGKSENPIRNALSVMASTGHIKLRTTSGGRKQTHRIAPLVDGKPFRKLKGFDDENPSVSGDETLQKPAEKPFRNLKGSPCEEPIDESRQAHKAPARDDHTDQNRDAHECASPYPVSLFKIGDVVNVRHGEAMHVEKIGFDGSEWFLKLKEETVFDIDALIVPLDGDSNPEFSRSWWNDGNEAKTDRIDWNPPDRIVSPAPKSRRKRDAAA